MLMLLMVIILNLSAKVKLLENTDGNNLILKKIIISVPLKHLINF